MVNPNSVYLEIHNSWPLHPKKTKWIKKNWVTLDKATLYSVESGATFHSYAGRSRKHLVIRIDHPEGQRCEGRFLTKLGVFICRKPKKILVTPSLCNFRVKDNHVWEIQKSPANGAQILPPQISPVTITSNFPRITNLDKADSNFHWLLFSEFSIGICQFPKTFHSLQ